MIRTTVVSLMLLAVTAPVLADIEWKHDVRAAFEEAEGRGVPLFIYLTRDD